MLGSLDTLNRQAYVYLTHIHTGARMHYRFPQIQKVFLLTLLQYARCNSGTTYELVLDKYKANQIKSTNQKNIGNQVD